jgi:hypothetical protein
MAGAYDQIMNRIKADFMDQKPVSDTMTVDRPTFWALWQERSEAGSLLYERDATKNEGENLRVVLHTAAGTVRVCPETK